VIVLVVLGMLWARRPRWHRAPVLASPAPVPAWSRPPRTDYPKPGEDPALRRLARLGGDWPAHVTVHGGPRRLTEGGSQ
jgi:hypothetical protein